MRGILTYHSLDETGSVISVHPATFRTQVEWLARSGPPVVSIEELLRLPANRPAVALTFDDGFANFATHAWPVLRDHGLPVTLFVPTAWVGRESAWDAAGLPVPVLPLLSWDGLQRLAGEGVELGSHTRSHPFLTRVSGDRLTDELQGSADRLAEACGRAPVGIAYPYGAVNAQVAAAAAARYRFGCTTRMQLLPAAPDPHLLPRLDAWYFRSPGLLELWGTMRFGWYVRARHGARRCRALLAGGAA
jgi:peptidoglycan/xylan/chitin deacetylase (PgdA/CDA1 family)